LSLLSQTLKNYFNQFKRTNFNFRSLRKKWRNRKLELFLENDKIRFLYVKDNCKQYYSEKLYSKVKINQQQFSRWNATSDGHTLTRVLGIECGLSQVKMLKAQNNFNGILKHQI
jgi:hypothetical protein